MQVIVCGAEDVERLLPMPEAMPAIVDQLERVYRLWGEGRAINRTRSDIVARLDDQRSYVLKSMDGSSPDLGYASVRTNSLRQSWSPGPTGITKRLEHGAGSLVFLFSTEHGGLIGIFPDEPLSAMRVGAASGVAARHLAPAGPLRMALLGSSGLARHHLYAIATTENVTHIAVHSPTPEHAQALVDEAARRLPAVRVEHIRSAEAAVRDADLVISATNSVTPTVRYEWLKPGCYVSCVKAAEIGRELMDRMDRVVVSTQVGYVHHYVIGRGDTPFEATDAIHLVGAGERTDPDVDFAAYVPLKDVVTGWEPGRRSPEERICFVNNIGLGLQFTAVAALAYERAVAAGTCQVGPLAIESRSGFVANFDPPAGPS